ncbi:MAG: undecaprenyl-diphosphate phosphatase [Acidobacteria bacterium]|nr:undecaprenyl-diphosphate phosphatase [Acidobacteriota bacterium]
MEIIRAIVLGVVQGVSEFLPISSSGHLELTRWLFEWNDLDPNLETAFDVAVHLGTLTGVIAYLWADVKRLVVAGVKAIRPQGRSPDGRLAWLLVLSSVPAAISGVLLGDALSNDRIWLIAIMLIVFGVVLWWADRLGGERGADSFTLVDALLMGFGQALALQPGVSRSGVTMTVARFCRFTREDSARLAFLMSLPIIAGAGFYSLLDTTIPSEFWPPFIVGGIAAALTGYAAVWGTMTIVRRVGFMPFVIYRVGLGVAVLITLGTGWR